MYYKRSLTGKFSFLGKQWPHTAWIISWELYKTLMSSNIILAEIRRRLITHKITLQDLLEQKFLKIPLTMKIRGITTSDIIEADDGSINLKMYIREYISFKYLFVYLDKEYYKTSMDYYPILSISEYKISISAS